MRARPTIGIREALFMLIGGLVAVLFTSWWLGLIFFATGLVGMYQWYTWLRRHHYGTRPAVGLPRNGGTPTRRSPNSTGGRAARRIEQRQSTPSDSRVATAPAEGACRHRLRESVETLARRFALRDASRHAGPAGLDERDDAVEQGEDRGV
jgi:hypothetical protein